MPILLICLLFFSPLYGINTIYLESEPLIPIKLEQAKTTDEITWGLMGRDSLPENQGMAFSYPVPRTVSVWMFNTLIDLSAAYLDANHIIREIHELKAFPEVMDPKRPVKNISDLKKYFPHEPIVQFFLKRAVKSSAPMKYIVEMNKNWFQKNGVKLGDAILWEKNSPEGFVVPTLDISAYLPHDKEATLLIFNEAQPRTLWAQSQDYVACLNADAEVIKLEKLRKHVILCKEQVKMVLIAPVQWLRKNHVQVGKSLNFQEINHE